MDISINSDISIMISQLETLLKQHYLTEEDRNVLQGIIDYLSDDSNKAAVPGPESLSSDFTWLKKVESLFLMNFAEPQFKVEWAAYELNLSERQFTRRLKQLTGLTPNHYLREMRLQSAHQILNSGRYKTIKEVSYAVGFLDTPYFSRLFQERFGILPSQLLK